MIYGIWLILTFSILGLLGYGVSQLGTPFALGLLVAFVMTQIAVRQKYGDWL